MVFPVSFEIYMQNGVSQRQSVDYDNAMLMQVNMYRTCVGSSSVVRSESGQTRFQCQRDVLSSSPSTQTYPALARR